MPGKLTKLIATAVSASVLSLAGATATGALAADGRTDAPAGTTAASSAAVQVKRLHDQLRAAGRAGDPVAVRAAAEQLKPILGQFTGTEASAQGLPEVVTTAADRATRLVSELLATESPDPVTVVTGILGSLLGALQALLDGLLGTLPVPIPLPPVPPLPVPPLPAPDLPVPLPPVPPVPDLPVPLPPVPPVPDLPAPDLPVPDLPVPDLPVPDLPTPELPDVPAPLPVPLP